MARIRLPMKAKGQDIVGCYGFAMEDGTRYTANRQGMIEVDNPAHLKIINDCSKIDFSTNMPTAYGDINPDDGTWCNRDHFHGFKWQKTCPRCGNELVAYDRTVAEEGANAPQIGY